MHTHEWMPSSTHKCFKGRGRQSKETKCRWVVHTRVLKGWGRQVVHMKWRRPQRRSMNVWLVWPHSCTNQYRFYMLPLLSTMGESLSLPWLSYSP